MPAISKKVEIHSSRMPNINVTSSGIVLMKFYGLLWYWLNLANLADFMFAFFFVFVLVLTLSFFAWPSILAIFMRSIFCLIRFWITTDSIFKRFGSFWWKTPNRCQYNHGSELIRSGKWSFFAACNIPISNTDTIINIFIRGCCTIQSFWGHFIAELFLKMRHIK